MSESKPLTRREKEITRHVANGYKNKEIAEKLYISVKTVETHRANIMNKLALSSAAKLIIYAFREGLAEIEE
jgi:two-component system response regulator NreC